MFKNFLKELAPKIKPLIIIAGLSSLSLIYEGITFKEAHSAPSLLEFRWDNSGNYKKLYYTQSSSEKRDRSTYYFVIRKKDRNTAILKLSVTVPEHFTSSIKTKKLKLCKVHLGSMLTRTKCKSTIPAIFEINKSQTSIEIFPDRPIPADDSYALVMKVFNPDKSGMFQFNALAQAPGKIALSRYLGSWIVDID